MVAVPSVRLTPPAERSPRVGPPDPAPEPAGAARPSPAGQRRPHRRPALDGVRALAVLAVVTYHFGGGAGSWLPGGFLGVDVFFVLSGYLITTLLLAEHARTGAVDLAAFWARRLRRLLPALVVVLLAVCAWVWWATPPDAYPRRREDVLWTLGYLANWHFVQVAEDYFAGYAAASPLRHAWSLAVEEQFYLVWPALLLGLLWLGRRLRPARPYRGGLTVLAAAAGLAAVASAVTMAVQYDPLSPSRAYYGTDGRVQELFAGVLLAVLVVRGARPGRLQAVRRRFGRHVLAVAAAGLGLLLVAMLVLSDAAPPYYLGGALAVSLATAALIAGLELRPGSRLATAFSWAPAVALGRISYGVYLWHWPVVVAVPVLPEHGLGEQVARQLLRVAITLGAAALSYRFVERPVLEGAWLRGPVRRAALAGAAAMALVVAAVVPATALPGSLGRQLAVVGDEPCRGETEERLVACVRPAGTSARPELVLLGDSTARSLGPGLDAWAGRTGAGWVQAAWKRCTATGLLVLPNPLPEPDRPAVTCAQQAPGLIDDVLRRHRPATVLVSEFWTHHQSLRVGDRTLRPGTPEHAAALRTAFTALVDRVAAGGGRTVLVELVPGGDSIGSAVAPGRPAGSARPPVPGARFVDGFNQVLRDVAAARPRAATTISVTDVVCADGCAAVRDGTVVRTDGVHYSTAYSRALVPVLLVRAGVG